MIMKLKPLEFKDSKWSPSGKPFQNVSVNGVPLFHIEWDTNYLNETKYTITAFGIVQTRIIADDYRNDVFFLTENSFDTLEDAQKKCEEIVENFVNFFLEE